MPDDDSALVAFMPSGQRGRVEAGTTLLDAARQVGLEIESICGGRQTCGRCQVTVEEGTFAKHGIVSGADRVTAPGAKEAELLVRRGLDGRRLSCAARVCGDVLVGVPADSQARKQVIRKSATDRVIAVDPTVRQVYVEVAEASLTDQRGDAQRLTAALADQWSLHDLRIDRTVLWGLQRALRNGRWAVTVTLWDDREILDVRPGYREGAYGLAVDVGSTTVAAHLCDLRTGAVLATESMANPQVIHGEDLMSRVAYAMTHDDGLERMRRAVIDGVCQLAAGAAATAGIRTDEIYEAVVVGNTVMHHILLGIDPVELGGAPFALATQDPIDCKARDLGLVLHPAAYVHLPALQAGHVGSDNVAVLLAEEPHRAEVPTLIVDVGTNAEIVLATPERVYSASSPTGPAFEGAQITHGMRAAPGAIERVRIDRISGAPRFKVVGDERWSDQATAPAASGICGSGVVEAIAQLYVAGIIRADGRFDPDATAPGVQWRGRSGAFVLATAAQTSSGRPILVTQEDVRAVQLAKAALYAGARLLMLRAGVEQVERIVLAGAFGSYIDPWHAMVLGLIPDCDLTRVHAVGNAAGDGARIALLNRGRRREAAGLARAVAYVETAVEPGFQDEFVAAMALPHARDAFPHLRGLPPRPAPPSAGSRRRRERARR